MSICQRAGAVIQQKRRCVSHAARIAFAVTPAGASSKGEGRVMPVCPDESDTIINSELRRLTVSG
jgi:hypothetical protein